MKNEIKTITNSTGSITLKAIKVVKWMSEETLCFTASVIFNGKVVGEASNEGKGGCTFIRYTSHEIRESVEAWAKTITPASIGYEFLEAVSAADICDHILHQKDEADAKAKLLAKIKKDAIKYITYLKADCGSGQYYSHKKNLAKGFTVERLTADVKAKGYTLVAEMSDEAIIKHFAL
jgi:hypothetical protein